MNDDDLIDEVATRFKSAQEWEDHTRILNIDDLKFGMGDSDNGYQWPQNIARDRSAGSQPMLTVNKTRVHCLHIINDAKQNKVAVKISPTGDGATYDAAQILQGVVRHIEYQSNAQDIYDNAVWWNVYTGIGYWRVTTDYIDDSTFDQEIYLKPVNDPMSVYLDPDIIEADGSDAKWGLFYQDIPRWQFDLDYPKYKDVTSDPLLELTAGMKSETHIRVVEYYRRNPKPDTLISKADGSTVLKSQLKGADAIIEGLMAEPGVKTRKVKRHEVEWFKIAGGCVIAKGDWPSQYIPIVRVIGEETFIDGTYDRRGHVRALKDPQRMYNYWASANVEMVALQPKAPFIGAMASFDGLETYWNQANTSALAWLPYNGYDDEDRPLPPPARQVPPQMSSAHMAGLKIAADDMQLVTGQHEEAMGQQSNAEAGVAIMARQRRGDQATYHFVDSLASAIRFTGRILIDMIPKVYDSARVIEVMEEDGSQKSVQIDPEHPEAMSQDQDGEDVGIIFNPSVGRYAVMADVGPSFGTRRQESFNAIMQLIAADKGILPIAGDLLMKAADFPMADELAERLKNMVPAQALGGPSQEAQAMQAQLQQSQQVIKKLMDEIANQRDEIRNGATKHQIEDYRAETERMKVVSAIDPEALRPIVRQLVLDAMGASLTDLQAQHGITPINQEQGNGSV